MPPMQDPLLIDIDEDFPELYTGDISTCGEVGSNSSSRGDDRPLQMRLCARDQVAVRLIVDKSAVGCANTHTHTHTHIYTERHQDPKVRL